MDYSNVKLHVALLVLVFSAVFYPGFSVADSVHGWYSTHDPDFYFTNPMTHCRDLAQKHSNTPYYTLRSDPAIPDSRKYCRSLGTLGQTYVVWVFLRVICSSGTEFNPDTKNCVTLAPKPDDCDPITPACLARAEKGSPDFCPSPYAGNPINFAIGNKFQQDTDYQASGSSGLRLSRSYNSLDGLWRHDYSTHLRTTEGSQTIALVTASGKELFFTSDGVSITTVSAGIGVLNKTSTGWQYWSANNERFTFDTSGRLTQWSNTHGAVHQFAYSGSQITVIDQFGNSLIITEDANHQPLSLNASGVQITYSYNTNSHLISVNRAVGGQITQRHYHYEDTRNNALLTGVTDERGVRYAIWSYDDQGRVISSEHANGADRVIVVYNNVGTVSVTNELGKVAKYSFQTIQGVRRITAIEGEPSPNCPSSNSTFAYDSRGLLKTKTDKKGHVTTYDYNERGLESSRTEAAGTPQARTILTTWHPDFFLPVTVTEPHQIITYTYDAQGRQLSQTVTPR